MPSKDALIRYRVINKYLKNGKAAKMEHFISGCEEELEKNVSQRTIEGDIYTMRYDSKLGFGAPIDFDRSRGAYVYTDETYSIDGIPLDKQEVVAVRFAASMLKQYRKVNILEEFQGAVQKIVDAVNMHRMSDDGSKIDFVVLEEAPMVKGTEHLDTLIECIDKKITLRITYLKFHEDEPQDYVVNPHLLKEYQGRWYLVALDKEKNEFRVFGLERIQRIHQFDLNFLRKQEDFDKFFKNSIGITTTAEDPSEIIVAFTEQQSKYLATQPLHDTQALIDEVDGKLIWQFTIIPTFEFTAKILGWGSEVEVLEPKWYRDEIIEKLNSTRKNYSE